MKITRTNKEYGYTVEYSCSECGVVIIPSFFIRYGEAISINITDLVLCSCGARLRDEWVYETVDEV